MATQDEDVVASHYTEYHGLNAISFNAIFLIMVT